MMVKKNLNNHVGYFVDENKNKIYFDSIYEEAFKFIINAEGKYSNDPYDAGGETIYGIAKNRQPSAFKLAYKLYIENDYNELLNYVKSFYYRNYWIRSKANIVNNKKIAFFLFDTAINMGIKRSIRLLQRSINHFIKKLNYEDRVRLLAVDGIFGNKTKRAFEIIKKDINMNDMFEYLISMRIRLYVKISYRGKNIKFLRGWMNRISNLINLLV